MVISREGAPQFMPFYEYECKQCGHQLEAMQKVNDAPLKKCPECGKSALQRLMSAPVFRLKGSGWYETDFKSDDEGKRNLADKPEADKPADPKPADDKKDTKETVAPEAAVPKDDKKAATSGPKPGLPKSGSPKPGSPKPAASKKTAKKRPPAPKKAVKRVAGKR
jgi:putative FmdB family regulatory protein